MIDFIGTIWWIIQSFAIFFALGAVYLFISVTLAIFNIKLPKFKPRNIYIDRHGIHSYTWDEMTDIPEWLDVAAKERMTDLETTTHILVGQDRKYMISVAQDRKSYTIYQQS